jgi:hypothetical protein
VGQAGVSRPKRARLGYGLHHQRPWGSARLRRSATPPENVGDTAATRVADLGEALRAVLEYADDERGHHLLEQHLLELELLELESGEALAALDRPAPAALTLSPPSRHMEAWL